MRRTWVLLLFVSLAAARGESTADGTPPETKKKELALAVIVHPDNPVARITFGELRAYFKMERQFWPNRKRCEIYLPASKTPESRILLKKVYRMSHKRLQKYWVRKLFSGEIPAKPSHVPSAAAAGSRVLKSVGAISVVAAKQVPPKVRVLLIDGKKPGDPGYALVGQAK